MRNKQGAYIKLTTDTPDCNVENALNLFYARDDGETMARSCGPEPECGDIKLTDFIRLAAKTMNIPDLALPLKDRDLDALMADMVADGPEEPEGLLALIHTAGWGFAELRERLKSYEDAGLPYISREQLAIIDRALGAYGYPAQVDVAIEEMSELTKALLKDRRTHDEEKREEVLRNIREEIADVYIMLVQLIRIYGGGSGFEDIDRYVNEKLGRLNLRLNFERAGT